MFNNYEKYYKNFCEYLLTTNAQLNVADMNSGVTCYDTFIAHIYGTELTTNYKYYAKYSECDKKIMLVDKSIGGNEKTTELKLESIRDYMYKEYSLIDTIKKIENYVFFNNAVYVFTDYGLMSIYAQNKEGENITIITSIVIWVINDKCIDIFEDYINEILVEIPTTNKQKNLSICTNGAYGINKSKLEIKPFDCNINANYNDDLPYDRLNELVNSEEEELILLHGEPGTGKTSVIKKLVHDNPTVEFIYFDFNLLSSFSDSKIFDFLSEHKHHVLIIEDCEKLFTDRNSGNQFLNSMLNLTDGIIGEAFGIKFICTFNCPKSRIDPAVLREGRLSLIYEFKKLTLEKTKALLPTATEPMALAQIYHAEDNGNRKKTKKIGF